MGYLVLVGGSLLYGAGEQLGKDAAAGAERGLQVDGSLAHRSLQSRGQLTGHTNQSPGAGQTRLVIPACKAKQRTPFTLIVVDFQVCSFAITR